LMAVTWSLSAALSVINNQYEKPSKRKPKNKPKMLEIRATKGDMLAVLRFKILVVSVLILLYKTSILVALNT
jgi:hypothetical protein